MSSEGSEEMKDERVDGELCAEHVRVDYMLFSVFFLFFFIFVVATRRAFW